MDDYRAVGIIEGFEEPIEGETTIDAWQHLVDTGLAWQLQGWFGRCAAAMALAKCGGIGYKTVGVFSCVQAPTLPVCSRVRLSCCRFRLV